MQAQRHDRFPRDRDVPRSAVSNDELVLFRQIRQRYKLLDDDEFNCLFDACHRAPEEAARIHARTLIAYSNIGLVISIAKRFAGRGVPLADLVHEGLMSVYLDSINNFKPERGCRFSTYATCWIRHAVGRLIENTGSLTPMRLPVHTVDDLRLVNGAQSAFQKSRGREPSFDELLLAVHDLHGKAAKSMTPKRLRKLLKHDPGMSISIDAPSGPSGSGRTLLDRLGRSDPGSGMAALEVLDEMRLNVERVKVALASLHELGQDVIALRYGWFGDPAMNLEQIGKRYGFSRQWISHILRKALRAIGQHLHKKPTEVADLLTTIGEMVNGPLLIDRSSTVTIEPGADDDQVLEDRFAILSEHAKNWRDRGDFVVFAPVTTLLAREVVPTLDGATHCVAALVAKGWADRMDGMDALRLRRLDKLPESRQAARPKKSMLRLKRHPLAEAQRPFRMPTAADVYEFLEQRSTERGGKRIACPAVTLLCVRFRLEPQAAVRSLVALQRRGAVVSHDDWRSVVLLQARVDPAEPTSTLPPRWRFDRDDRRLEAGA